MLARLARELPIGDYLYEPKWDGFRCLAFGSQDLVDLRSRNDRPLARYFPELTESFLSLAIPQFAIDGEIVVASDSRFDFEALLARLHPAASRVEQLRHRTPASLMAFDLLAVGQEDLRSQPFAVRRARLAELLEEATPPIALSPITEDSELASAWLDRSGTDGIDGVVAKHRAVGYQPGRRAMVKVKRERTAECVSSGISVAGRRTGRQLAATGSLGPRRRATPRRGCQPILPGASPRTGRGARAAKRAPEGPSLGARVPGEREPDRAAAGRGRQLEA
jgi:ATP-dependent DNA ligase